MPWEIKRRDGKYVVVKKGSDKVVGRHSTKGEAEAQLRALYANVHVSDGKKSQKR